MKILLTLLLVFVTYNLQAKLSIEGSYQGKNLFVQNPNSSDGFGFCVDRVTVNGNIMIGNINRSAFEIDFTMFNIKIGDKVFIEIEHEDDCTPKILNPEVLLPKSTFIVTDISVDKSGEVVWTTEEENGELPFVVEQFRWNKWIPAGEVRGEGTEGPNTYRFKIDLYSGENKIRIVQSDFSGEKRASEEKTFESDIPSIKMYPKKVKSDIFFEAEGKPYSTRYEIYDAYGNIVKKGYSKSVNCKNLRKGAYYINFDNKTEKFIKS
ncbi:MAG: hypothetical protein WC994_09240 [Brumimicrobium sp.]